MSDLQKRCGEWHAKRFPTAKAWQVGLKLGEEFGELAEALNHDLDPDYIGDKKTSVIDECADVTIVMMVLLERYCSGTDLLKAVERKLAKLNDPKSGHRAAVNAE